MEYNEMIPGRVYAGERLRDGADWEELRRLNVNAIVNISSEPDDIPSDYPDAWLLHFPLGNKDKPPLPYLTESVDQTITRLKEGRILYIHDISGRNRLGFFLTALFMRLYRRPSEEALQAVKSKRPILSPRYQFLELLCDYERQLGH